MRDIYNFIGGEVKYVDSKCNLQQNICKEILSDGTEVEFSITPKNIPVMKPLQFDLKIDDVDIDNIEFKIFGINMDMGLFNFKLKKEGEGHYMATGLIPSCVVDMKWEGNLILYKKSEKVGVKFKFESSTN